MKQKKVWITLLLFIAVLALGIGYALISSMDLVVNGSLLAFATDGKFEVEFSSASISSKPEYAEVETSIDEDDPTKAYLNISNFNQQGDQAVILYRIYNLSTQYKAELQPANIYCSKPEWFDISCEYLMSPINKATQSISGGPIDNPGQGFATVTVKLIKEPTTTEEVEDANGTITIDIPAIPVD